MINYSVLRGRGVKRAKEGEETEWCSTKTRKEWRQTEPQEQQLIAMAIAVACNLACAKEGEEVHVDGKWWWCDPRGPGGMCPFLT